MNKNIMNDLVSVIIPVYNAERYLNECIQSVLNNTYSNFELLCIDDGSTDKSLEILKKFACLDSRIKIITKKNGGVSSARNIGLHNCHGDYVMFLDADDYLTQDCIETLIDELKKNNADIVSARAVNQLKNNLQNSSERWEDRGDCPKTKMNVHRN